jgi:mRNA interferase YafQ
MLKIFERTTYKKDKKKFSHNEKIKAMVQDVVLKLLNGEKLELKYKDHPLIGDKKEFRECHLLPDVVLVYSIDNTYLNLIRLCNHAELLKK